MIQDVSHNYTAAIKAIRQAILKSRYKAVALANREMLSLYFGIREYIALNSRKGFWGTNAIEVLSQQLQKELPGLRGFSASNMKRMRLFYETWNPVFQNRPPLADEIDKNRQLAAVDLQADENEYIIIRPLVAGEFHQSDMYCFLQTGFTHHCEIIEKTNSLDERIFYIQKCATEFWSKEKLRYNLKSDLFHQQGSIIHNFVKTISETDFRGKALQSFKDEYLLDFINIEDPDEEDERLIENQIVLNIKKFIMALGTDFTFIGNQHRLIVDERDFFVDLLFFNRQLQSLIAIDLKKKDFKPEYVG
jgi:predicted nuclease of restriction endonuclease-like (RecB) superfamily